MQVKIRYIREYEVIRACFDHDFGLGKVSFTFTFEKGSYELNSIYNLLKNNSEHAFVRVFNNNPALTIKNDKILVHCNEDFKLELPVSLLLKAFSKMYAINNDLEDI